MSAPYAAMLILVVLLMLWLAGAFHPKIGSDAAPPGREGGFARAAADSANSDAPLVNPPPGATLVTVRKIRVPITETAVGTIRAVHETAVASKLLARVAAVPVKAGQAVRKGELLVQLDDVELKARLEQVEAAVRAAEAARDQAKTELDRLKELLARESASRLEFDRADSAHRAAAAELERARQARTEAQTVLGYAVLCSASDGVVIDKRVEPGDTVSPGQVLLTMYDPARMQLVASVRESLTHRLSVGQPIGVRVDALNKTCEGRVSEIVPEAQSASRTFSVKVTGPCPPGIFSGMFGRLLIPLEDEEVLVIPSAAVRRVGQLEMVEVVQAGRLARRAVQLGRTLDGGDVEVLSGLRDGEFIAVRQQGGGT
jgi:RND family efflux transporter MFP subunit